MAISLSQTSRIGQLTTALGDEKLLVLRFKGGEHINGLFDFEVEAVSDRNDVDFDAVLGTHATATIMTKDQGPVPFDGIVTQMQLLGPSPDGWRYRLTLQPWFALLGLRRRQQIYHNMTVVEILDELFAPYDGLGRPAVENKLTESYPTLEYTVQYRETDLDFATRMMERFGISYHFIHDEGSHTLVLSDNVTAHEPIPGQSRKYISVSANHRADEEHFWAIRPTRRMTTGAVRLTDYNFKKPSAAMEVDRIGAAGYAEGQLENYDYPGDYDDQGGGKAMARLRLDQELGQNPRHHADGDCVSLRAGMTLTVSGDAMPGVGKSICLSAHHDFSSNAYGTGTDGSEPSYEGQYVLMPEDAPLRPERKTKRALVQGPQTAVVVGTGGIDCDEYGRVLVRFHWDLDKRYSMRCRVSQNWAGRGWGGMVVPRIGMEVVVEFLEGNPDKPLITGCVYNGANVPPSELPANKTKSIFKTNSEGAEGFNELTFEDKGGEEFIYMHAQKDLEMHVENSAKRRVEFDDNVSVGNASNLDVAADRTETIEGSMNVTVTGAILEKTDADRGADIGGDYAIKTGGDLTIKAGGEIVLDASKITLVSGGAAVTVQGGAVNAAPVLNVGSASPGAAAIPAIPSILKAAAGAGSPFVSHCPMKEDG